MRPLSMVTSWPVSTVAAASIGFDGAADTEGDTTHVFHLASLSKVFTTWAVLIAVEDGSIALDAPVGQPGCTLRHLLSHAGGYPFQGTEPILGPGLRRIYSNSGIDIAAAAVAEATGIEFGEYLGEAVFEPLGLKSTVLHGSPANGMWSNVDDVARFLSELITPTLVHSGTAAEATSIQFPDLAGRLPGMVIFDPCPWGLGVEIKGGKDPHWMGRTNSPEAFGHFGGAGTMMWVDPVARTSMVALTDRQFDDWALTALRVWPEISDAVIAGAS